nr:ribosomal protein S8 [Haplothismia exannulata]
MGMNAIVNIITSIRNVDIDKKEGVRIKFTKFTENIVEILIREGFIENVRKHQENHNFFLVSSLRHKRTRKEVYKTILKRISRPGFRIYSNYHGIPKILGGMGIAILSTSRGIMTDQEARIKRMGGEILLYIW